MNATSYFKLSMETVMRVAKRREKNADVTFQEIWFRLSNVDFFLLLFLFLFCWQCTPPPLRHYHVRFNWSFISPEWITCTLISIWHISYFPTIRFRKLVYFLFIYFPPPFFFWFCLQNAMDNNWLVGNFIRNALKLIEYTYWLHFQLPRRVKLCGLYEEKKKSEWKNEEERRCIQLILILIAVAIIGYSVLLFVFCCWWWWWWCCYNDIKEEAAAAAEKKSIWLWTEKIFIQIYIHSHTAYTVV